MGSPKPSRVTTMQLEKTVAHKRLQGKSQKIIAKELGIAPSTVSKTLDRSGAKRIIEQGMERMIHMVPKVADNYESFLDDEDKYLRLSASRDILKITGMTPTASNNFVMTSITNNQSNDNVVQIVDPRAIVALTNALQALNTPQVEGNVIDVVDNPDPD